MQDPTQWIDSRLNDSGNLFMNVDLDDSLSLTQRLRNYQGQRLQGLIVNITQHIPSRNRSTVLKNIAFFFRNHDFSDVEVVQLIMVFLYATTEEVDALVEAMCDNTQVSGVWISLEILPSKRVIHRLFQEKSKPRCAKGRSSSLFLTPDDCDPAFDAEVVMSIEKDMMFSLRTHIDSQLTNLVRAIVTSGAEKVAFTMRSVNGTTVFTRTLLAVDNVNVPHFCFDYPPPPHPEEWLIFPHHHPLHPHRNEQLVERRLDEEVAAIYAAAVRYRAVQIIEFKCPKKIGTSTPPIEVVPAGHQQHQQQQQQQQQLAIDDPLDMVHLENCKLAIHTSRFLALRSIKALRIVDQRHHLVNPIDDDDDFLNNHFYQMLPPLLSELILQKNRIGADEMKSLCHFLATPDCHVTRLQIGSSAFHSTFAQDGEHECATLFFDQLGTSMPSLQYLEFHYSVTSVQVADAIAAGFRSNTTLRKKVEGLSFGTTSASSQEIEFFLRCYKRGRYLVAKHLEDPASTPLALFPRVLNHSLSSGRDNDVAFYFLKQIMPSLLVNGLDLRCSCRQLSNVVVDSSFTRQLPNVVDNSANGQFLLQL